MSDRTGKTMSEANDVSGDPIPGLTDPIIKPPTSLRARLDLGESPIHNFDGDRLNQFRLTALATGGQPLSGDDATGVLIDLRYWYAHRITLQGKTPGELVDCDRVAMIDKSQVVYAFVSSGVIDAIDMIRSIFGDGPYDDAVKFRIRAVLTRKGNRTYTIDPVS